MLGINAVFEKDKDDVGVTRTDSVTNKLIISSEPVRYFEGKIREELASAEEERERKYRRQALGRP